jgi:hypothetical protein
MNNLCRFLNIPVPFLKEDFNKKKYSTARFQELDKNDISQEYFTWIKSLGLMLEHAGVFFSVPRGSYIIHRDDHTRMDFPKINWVYGDLNSEMNWYKIKPEATGSRSHTVLDTQFVKYELDEVELLYSKKLKSPSLVQSGMPHNVSNINEFRWCVSTVYLYPNRQLLSWADAERIFQPYMEETLVQTN